MGKNRQEPFGAAIKIHSKVTKQAFVTSVEQLGQMCKGEIESPDSLSGRSDYLRNGHSDKASCLGV